MAIEGIGSEQIDSMLAMLRNTAARAAPPSMDPLNSVAQASSVGQKDSVARVSFADALKHSLNQVNQVQSQAQQMADKFTLGDDKVSISDVMIAAQKANISLQTTVQVRNKMVAAYTDIMNMQI